MKMKNKKITIYIMLALNISINATPLEMGDGNRQMLAENYSKYSFTKKQEYADQIMFIYAEERARQRCVNEINTTPDDFSRCMKKRYSDEIMEIAKQRQQERLAEKALNEKDMPDDLYETKAGRY